MDSFLKISGKKVEITYLRLFLLLEDAWNAGDLAATDMVASGNSPDVVSDILRILQDRKDYFREVT